MKKLLSLGYKVILGVTLAGLCVVGHAQEDHPLVGRYPGAELLSKRYSEFVEAKIVTGITAQGGRFSYDTLDIEGENFFNYYKVSPEVSASGLRVIRTLEKGLVKKGWKPLYSCAIAKEECDKGININQYPPRKDFYSNVTHIKTISPRSESYQLGMSGTFDGEQYYLTIRLRNMPDYNQILYFVDVLKLDELDLPDLEFSEAVLDQGIQAFGSVQLAGIYFDTGKSTIKPESKASLDIIFNYIKKHPGQQYLVVGHTDTIGSLEDNVVLSKSRAAAVIAALVNIDAATANQLIPFGAGFSAPKASNREEFGRQLNRRVELVEVSEN